MTLNFVPQTDKMKSNTRQLKLTAMDGKPPTDSKGMVDKRLFSGENSLYAVMEPQTSLWSLKYEHGQVPTALQSNWTTFQGAYKEAKIYFNNRNVEITEIVD